MVVVFWCVFVRLYIHTTCMHHMPCDVMLFPGMPNNTGLDVVKLMAKVPCKEDMIFRNSTFRKAVSRYVRCYSQVRTMTL